MVSVSSILTLRS